MITTVDAASSADVAGHYDELDGFFRDLWGEHLHHGLWETGAETVGVAVERLVDRVAECLGISEDDHVCDVGCGYGATARYLARTYDARVTGVTLSAVQQAFATERAGGDDRVRILLENWETNSFDDDSFDGLVSIECVSHVENKSVFFEQVARVLRGGSHGVVIAWLAAENPTRWQRSSLLEPICRECRLPGMGTESDYAEMIESAGLELVRFDDLSRQVRKTWRICARRVLWGLCTRPSYWRFLWLRKSTHSVFLFSVYRILAAYYLGAMRYGLFVLEKPAAA